MRRIALLLLTIGAVLAPAAMAGASTFPVTNTTDSAAGSLRLAIQEANANPGKDSIPISATGTIELESALPIVSGELDIAGPGQSALTVRRRLGVAAAFRIFEIQAGTPTAPVSISGMTIENGKAEVGGGINVDSGTLTLTRVTVSGNEATFAGGGIAVISPVSGGPLTLRESLIVGNLTRTPASAGPLTVRGGGVVARAGGLIERSTISSNFVLVDNATGRVEVFGGGLSLEPLPGGQGEIRQSTIAQNTIRVGPGATQLVLRGAGATLVGRVVGSTIAANTIVAPSPGLGANLFASATAADSIVSSPEGGPSCAGGITSEGFNIDDGTSCGFNQPTDRSGTDPLLAPALSFNGGPTPNFALLPGSPAIDHGKAFGARADQRGRLRPSDFATIANAAGGDGSDIGAFELNAPPPGPPPARLYLMGFENALSTVATIKTQSNEVIGEPFSLRNVGVGGEQAIAISPDGTRAYVANRANGNVSVIDTATNAELPASPIALRASNPNDIAISPDGTRVYLASEDEAGVSVIDTATNAEIAGSPIALPALAGFALPEASAIAITPDGRRAYVADLRSDLLYMIDTQTNAVIGQPIDLAPGSDLSLDPTAIAIGPDGKRAYVTSFDQNEVIVVDTQTNAPIGQPISAGIFDPNDIAISPDGTRAYVVNQGAADPRANTLAVIDTQTNRLLSPIPVGRRPNAVAITPDGARVYVANDNSNDVSVIDANTNQALGPPIEMGADVNPANLAVVPNQGPRASFSAPATLRLGAPLRLDASPSRDPDGAVSAYEWDFGDGAKASGQSPQHPYTAPGTYNLTLTVADNEGCSTGRVFTGQTASCNGSAAAKASHTVNVVLPAVRVSCPAKAKPKGCQVRLRVVTKKRHGKAETAPVKAKLRAGKSKLLPLHPLPAFIATLATANRALVKETVKIGRLRHTRLRSLAIR
jgi:YVTN family beta-propeller protein